jgi:hypothetical protein
MPPKVTTKDGNAPTPASEEKTSTLVKPRRIYSPSKRSTRDFCGNEFDALNGQSKCCLKSNACMRHWM